MERGPLSWEDTDRIDRVRRAHAQKHIPSGKQNWGRAEKKPWFCKNFQTNSCPYQKDHDVNGRVNRHKRANSCSLLGWSSCTTVGSKCEPTVVTKVSSELNHGDHTIVTAEVGKSCVIDNNLNK